MIVERMYHWTVRWILWDIYFDILLMKILTPREVNTPSLKLLDMERIEYNRRINGKEYKWTNIRWKIVDILNFILYILNFYKKNYIIIIKIIIIIKN